MEIRNALQKIENYLTVVSNLNRTILSEGTMSRDELLLMKKYLYTSIDRVEDIERLLLIDQNDAKSFVPTTSEVPSFVAAKEKEIVAVKETEHIEEVEASLNKEQQFEMEEMVEEIHSEIENEKIEVIGEIATLTSENETVEEIPQFENIITEDYSLNKAEDKSTVLVTVQDNQEVASIKSFAESIITEDYSLNKLFEEKSATTTIETILPKGETTSFVESIITEDYSLNKVENTITPTLEQPQLFQFVEETTETIENTLTTTLLENSNSLADSFQNTDSATLTDAFANITNDDSSILGRINQKNINTETTLNQEFIIDEQLNDELVLNAGTSLNETNNHQHNSYIMEEQNDLVLVAEQEEETTIQKITPSVLMNAFKQQTVAEISSNKSYKTLSESITLNDKFIFVRELFGNQFSEYDAALKHLDTFDSQTSAEQYCNTTLWNKYNWTERGSIAARFLEVLRKKFENK